MAGLKAVIARHPNAKDLCPLILQCHQHCCLMVLVLPLVSRHAEGNWMLRASRLFTRGQGRQQFWKAPQQPHQLHELENKAVDRDTSKGCHLPRDLVYRSSHINKGRATPELYANASYHYTQHMLFTVGFNI